MRPSLFTPQISHRLQTLLFINRIPFLRPHEKKYLISSNTHFEHQSIMEYLLECSVEQWRRILGRNIRHTSWNNTKKILLQKALYHDMQWIARKKGRVCTIDDKCYPSLLRTIPDPPIVLYVRGNMACLEEESIAVVGTRSPNKDGIKSSYAIGKYLSTQGIHIVSGLAYGIDIAVHKGVIDYVAASAPEATDIGNAIVVLGTSIDYVYPRSHIIYAQKILQQGGVIISEIPPNQNTHKNNFIGRNRIISGLSSATVVVQAPEKSGALATAMFALEQGRDVLVDASGVSELFKGTQSLYEQGAKILYLDR